MDSLATMVKRVVGQIEAQFNTKVLRYGSASKGTSGFDELTTMNLFGSRVPLTPPFPDSATHVVWFLVPLDDSDNVITNDYYANVESKLDENGQLKSGVSHLNYTFRNDWDLSSYLGGILKCHVWDTGGMRIDEYLASDNPITDIGKIKDVRYRYFRFATVQKNGTTANDISEDDLIRVLNAGIEAKRKGDYQAAIKHNQDAIGMAPHDQRPYKNISKVLIGVKAYEAAIRALIMKIQLGIYYTNRSDELEVIEQTIMLRQLEMSIKRYGEYLQPKRPGNIFSDSVRIGDRTVPENFVPTLIKDHRICFDIAKLLWAEDDLFFNIGHSYVRQHPDSFSMYNIPAENMDALEMGLLGRRPHCPDLRDSEEFAPIFYISGFLVCVANIRQLLPDVAAETIYGFLRQPLQFDLKALLDN